MSTTGTTRSPAPPHPWLGVGSPGIGGYVLAVLASAAVLPLVLGVGSVLDGAGLGSWSATDVIPTIGFYVAFVVVALVYGSPAAVLGCLVVHLVGRRVRSQVVHVAAAGLVGAATGWAYGTVLFDGDWEGLWWQLGIATAIGRAVVIPLALRRTS